MSTIFYPKLSGMTKEEVIESINERFEDDVYSTTGEGAIRRPDINKLTDEMMQHYLDEKAKVFYDSLEHGVEFACMQEEDELEKLARLIQKDVVKRKKK